MKIAIASGKGGTGKTTVATNLAKTVSSRGRSAAYIDCDVEEPNGHVFLKPSIEETRLVHRQIPEVEADRCTSCGQCAKICQYSAIVCLGGKPLVFPELCHGCAGCWLVCEAGAISPGNREIGQLAIGRSDGVAFVHGVLNVGEAMSPPLIRQVKQAGPSAEVVIFDAPPGTSCPVIETIRDADFAVLVTEPTPFGLWDLKLAVEMVRALERPFGVVINRSDSGDAQTSVYCAAEGIEVLAEIPDDRRIAEAYSRGEMVCDALPEYRRLYEGLLDRLEERTVGRG